MMGRSLFPKALWQAAMITALGLIGGLVINGIREDGLRLQGTFLPEESASISKENGLQINLEEAEGFFVAQAAVFIDTRDRAAYEEGHIRGAKALPWGDFDFDHEKVLEDVEKDAYIICYCDGAQCNSSEHVAVALIEKGYSSVYVLFNGWTLWKQNGLPTEKGPPVF